IRQRRRRRHQVVANADRPVLGATQLEACEAPAVFAGVTIQTGAGHFPALDAFIADGNGRRVRARPDGPTLVDAELFCVPIEQLNWSAGRADAADDDRNLLVALGQQAEIELPTALANERPARVIKRRFGFNGRQLAVPQPDEVLLDFVEGEVVAGRDDFSGGVGDPDGNTEAAETRTETAARLVITFARFGTAGHRKHDVALAARPGIVRTLEHRVDDLEPRCLREEGL